MTYRERIVRGRISSEHLVQFFDSDDTRAQAVAWFVRDALEAGENVLVAATAPHWMGVCTELRLAGVELDAAMETGRLVFKDANALLRELMRRGRPDAYAFGASIGSLVRLLGSSARVSVYGELVDILASERELDGVIALEQLWNDLGEEVSFRLLCGYAAAHFVDEVDKRLRDVCRAHTHVHAGADDPLGAWLLGLARLPFETDPVSAH